MKHLLSGIIMVFLCGCGGLHDSRPPDLISQDSMIRILVDIHVADAVVEQQTGAQTPSLALTNALYERIYKNHGISAAQFKTSYKYYEANAQLMDKMYEQIITELSRKEAEMNK